MSVLSGEGASSVDTLAFDYSCLKNEYLHIAGYIEYIIFPAYTIFYVCVGAKLLQSLCRTTVYSPVLSLINDTQIQLGLCVYKKIAAGMVLSTQIIFGKIHYR